jgi:hypothetical protein
MQDAAPIIKKKPLNDWSRDELLSLPHRAWQTSAVYDSLLLLSTRRKHDSGWAMVAIIGVVNHMPTEVATACSDDVEWVLPPAIRFGERSEYAMGQMRMDCAFRSGAMHFWTRTARFKVGDALSSVTVEVLPIRADAAVQDVSQASGTA